MGLHVIGRLARDRTRYEHDGHWYTLDELYQRHKRRLVKEPELGLSLALVPVTCGHGLKATIILAKGYQEPELEARPRDHQKPRPTWAAFLCTDLTLTGPEVVKKYLGRWAIEVFFKEAKQRLGLGREQGHSFAAQVFSVFQAFFRYSLLAYLLEHDEQSQTIGEMFRQLEEETGKLTFLERLRHYLAALLRRICDTLADFYDPSATFRAYLDAITNAFNDFPILQGCER